MNPLDYLFIGIYILLLAFVVLRSRFLKITMSQYAVDNRTVAGYIVFFSLSASFIGPGYTIGIAEQGFIHGFNYLLILIAFSAQTLLVGYFIAPRLRKYEGAYTVGDIMGYHYGRNTRIITGIISLLFCAGIVGVIARVGGLLMQNFFGIPFVYGVIFITALVVIYSIFGGIKAVIKTDVFQFVVLSSIVIIFAIILLYRVHADDVSLSLFSGNFLEFSSSLRFEGTAFLALFLGFLLGETLVPPYTNRAFVSRTPNVAKKGFIMAGFFSLIWFMICLLIGVYARSMYPSIEPENAFMQVSLSVLPIGLKGLLMVALASIVMSSQDSYLNAASVSFVRDLLNPFKARISDHKSLFAARVMTLIIGVLGIIFAINAPGIIGAIMINYTLWAPSIVLPLVMAILMPNKVTKPAGFFSVIAGIVTVLAWRFVFAVPFGIPEIVPGLIMNQVVFWSLILWNPPIKIKDDNIGIELNA